MDMFLFEQVAIGIPESVKFIMPWQMHRRDRSKVELWGILESICLFYPIKFHVYKITKVQILLNFHFLNSALTIKAYWEVEAFNHNIYQPKCMSTSLQMTPHFIMKLT